MCERCNTPDAEHEPEEMTRRQFGMASGGIALAPAFFSFPSRNTRTLDVNIYVGEEIYDEHSRSDIRAMLDLYEKNITYAFETLTDGTDTDVSVTASRERIPSYVGGRNADWLRYIENDNLRSPADDSNLLLTGHENPDFSGRAYTPCRVCDPSDSTAGSVFGVDPTDYQFFASFDDQIIDTVTSRTSYNGIMTAIHEVGHNAGLQHHHSEITRKNGREYETIMGTEYHKSDGPFYRINKFADHLTADDLRLSEDGGVNESWGRRLSGFFGF